MIAWHRKHEAAIWLSAVGCTLGGFVLACLCLWGYNANWSEPLNATAQAYRVAAYVFFGVYIAGLIAGFPTWVKGPRYDPSTGKRDG